MKRILLVDDEPQLLQVYGEGLRLKGFEVETAEDGLAAAKALRKAKPDAIVLDLMMPKLTGVDVLKFIRGQASLADVPVVVLSNAYLTDLARQAEAAGVDKAFMKCNCTPAMLAETLDSLLNAQAAGGEGAQRSGAGAAESVKQRPETEASGAPTSAPGSSPTLPEGDLFFRPSPPSEVRRETQDLRKARQDFLDRGPATMSTLRSLFRALHQTGNDVERSRRLQSLYTKVHFLTVAARMGECHRFAEMASVLEALLLELTSYSERTSSTVLSTVGTAVDFLGILLEHDKNGTSGYTPAAEILALVLDDDAMSRHVTVSALHNAHFKVEGAGDPLAALPLLNKKQYGLITLVLEMPGMDGLEFCRRVRQLPGYQRTPVIFVISHSEAENRVKDALGGGQDLIGKPILPMELAVKAVTQSMKSQLLTSSNYDRLVLRVGEVLGKNIPP